ncbi:hypothetical protein [Bombilactobacillus thymidiniphilus]|uniref:Glycine zipper domain-containing protein n=1 Tax=Bombilactobacillus thymidiniphilus TaxID=2923363 RepID=A0ABY4PBY0_9LACO|nr:hypothetical protein [Bombilactobacillus thymidiniphilus]UQS83192.1 hypothetical protein MOO47_05240 [Bombilactobacillus thymidiniphilus]
MNSLKKFFTKHLYQAERRGNIKLYGHSQVSNDLEMTNKYHRANAIEDSKIGKGLGIISDAIDWVDDFQNLNRKHSALSSAAYASEHLAVTAGTTALGSSAGTEVGAAMGAAIGTVVFPGLGTEAGAAIGSVAGDIIGGWIGDSAGSAINDKTDKHFHLFG